MKMMNTKAFQAFSDLPGYTTTAGGSVPVHLCPTVEKPDIVIIDEKKKTVDIF